MNWFKHILFIKNIKKNRLQAYSNTYSLNTDGNSDRDIFNQNVQIKGDNYNTRLDRNLKF